MQKTFKKMLLFSAGIGRTGTFIALDILTKQGGTSGYVVPVGCVTMLRNQRTNMVQTKVYYHIISAIEWTQNTWIHYFHYFLLENRLCIASVSDGKTIIFKWGCLTCFDFPVNVVSYNTGTIPVSAHGSHWVFDVVIVRTACLGFPGRLQQTNDIW